MVVALAIYIGYSIGYFIVQAFFQVVFWTVYLLGMALFAILKYTKKIVEWTVKLLAILLSLAYTKACLM